MKLLTISEFLALEGNVIFAPYYGSEDDGCFDMSVGDLEVRFEMLNKTNWYSYQIGGDDLQTLSGADMDELSTITKMVATGEGEIPYDPAGTRQYPSLYDDNQKFIVLDDEDVTLLVCRLIEHFPKQAADAFDKMKRVK